MGAPGGALQGPLDGGFDVSGKREVLDGTAGRADEVVVVLGEVLGELVAGELAAADDAPHDAGFFEQGEVAVSGALRQALVGLQQLRQCQRTVGTGQGRDDGTPVAGVALIGLAQPRHRGVVDVGTHARTVPLQRTKRE